MRDGVHLFTAVYVPKDASATNTYPIMFDRTPYSVRPYGSDNYPGRLGPSEHFTRAKYIVVFTQTGFASKEDREGHAGGWGECFERLDSYIKKGAKP